MTTFYTYPQQTPSRDIVTAARQAITLEWWNEKRLNYETYISALVQDEISGGDPQAASLRLEAVQAIPSLAITEQASFLAELLLDQKAVPANSVEDALHIGIAATQGAEFLLTWNFKHINNAETKSLIEKTIQQQGLICPVLCSPEELGA